jgi:hypothetical protein
LGSEMIVSASSPTAVLSISFFLTVWVTPENQPAELSRLFCFYGKIFGVPKWSALSKSRVTIDPGTAGSRELEETAVSIFRHTLKPHSGPTHAAPPPSTTPTPSGHAGQETDSSHRSRLSSNGQCIFSPMASWILASMNEPDSWHRHGSPALQMT